MRLDLNLLKQLAPVYLPSYDVKETPEQFLFIADLPGLGAHDVDVEIRDGRLIITGERESEPTPPEHRYFSSDRHFGCFCLDLPLPSGSDGDQVLARMGQGVLTVQVGKLPPKPGRCIPVATSH